MAKTKTVPGSKPRYGERREYHILLPVEDGTADTFEQLAKQQGGIVAYVERLVRQDIAAYKQLQ